MDLKMAKTIIITGAGSGVGADTARTFLNSGWNVALLGRRLEPLENVANGGTTRSRSHVT